jgi:hypothetical protein
MCFYAWYKIIGNKLPRMNDHQIIYRVLHIPLFFSANPVLELKSGDKVFVRNGSSGSQIIVGNHYSYFSGYFISE